MDFVTIGKKILRSGDIQIYPKFIVTQSSDLMIRGGDFYAIWVEDFKLWSTDEQDAIRLIDRYLDDYVEKNKALLDGHYQIMYMWDAESGSIDRWHKYCKDQLRDNFHVLDENLTFANDEVTRKDYASKKLQYSLQEGNYSSWDTLIGTLYSEEERHKIEWCIGSIVNGASRNLQKFMVLYGSAGTGKSTVMNIIQKLFDGYCSTFDARALGSSSNAFALEAFKSNPLVAIQHDGDLSHIEDNTRLNSLVSHELMTVNEKFKSTYANRFKAFLIMGTNRPVKITDAKSGLIRRLIDVSPSGEKVSPDDYERLMTGIDFELGAIAYHCKQVYEQNPRYYDSYIPVNMMGASNDFFNYVSEFYLVFKKEDSTSLKSAWEMYKGYCEDSRVQYPLSQRAFKEELKNYFSEYYERYQLPDGSRIRSYYSGFIFDDKFENERMGCESKDSHDELAMDCTSSIFDEVCASCFAQYATGSGIPEKSWNEVSTTLKDINTNALHYVRVPENHIVIDFDIQDENGNKLLDKNLEAASKWPPTYAELSKSGKGVHLHYYYTGNPEKLSRIYDLNIEIKVFTGKSSLRRKLTKCNNLPIATITSGLPLKGEKVINPNTIKSERSLRVMIQRNFNKEFHPGTKPSIDFINKILDDAYNSGLHYDVSDMRSAIFQFAMQSTHQSEYCMKLVQKMKFKSDEPSNPVDYPVPPDDEENIVFYDVEVFSNLFVICWKKRGKNSPVVKMINPSSEEVESLLARPIVGFNNRKYDNHMLYARLMGYTNEQLYKLSQKIIGGDKEAFFGEAYNLSYTDIYDFASASNKKSLKKLEIEMGIHHQELGLPWDKPVPEDMWLTVADYCANDVIATEAAFDYLKADWTARKILAKISGMTVNDTTNAMSARFIFGKNRHPQSVFNYRNMGDTSVHTQGWVIKEGILYPEVDDYTLFDDSGNPVFPGYKYEFGKSQYRGEDPKEGGYVYAEPGMYVKVALLDIASMHPTSTIEENLFGDEYTNRFQEIKDARVCIKHRDFEKAKNMLGGILTDFLVDESMADDLANALKTVINSVYGLTSAKFENPFKDPRNVDNIVAKRGALFMVNLKHAVQERGFTVAHIKTDSIKIPNATNEIIQFVMDYGARYGYSFEHEATYDRMCLVNDAVYIAKYDSQGIRNKGGKHANEWTATGTQFAVPYVFKTLFSKEPIEFEDLCETKSVTSALYLDMNENLPNVEAFESERDKMLKLYKNGDLPIDVLTRRKELDSLIYDGHAYHFVGRVGQFCPIKPGCGGGLLVREAKDPKTGDKKYASATGAKDFRWLESEQVKLLNKQKDIDIRYYNALVDKAVESISTYGDFEWFSSDDPFVGPHFVSEETPPWD